MHQSFLTVLSVSDVVARLLSVPPLPAVTCPLEELALRGGMAVLASDIPAGEDLPPADRSAMDGYAVRSEDLFGASEFNPVWLECRGRIPVNVPPAFALDAGYCAEIATGGFLPEGADAVVMVEQSKRLGAETVELYRSTFPGEHVLCKGDDVRSGDMALPAGTLLRAQETGLLAALGITEVPVIRRPRVTLLSTGDELVPPSTPHPEAGQIRDVNSLAIATMLSGRADVRLGGIIPDDADRLIAAMLEELEPSSSREPADVLFLSGGSSAGTRDLTLTALQRIPGMEILCHGVALSPGKPLILARRGSAFIWGLPGQVASAQVVMFVLGLPFIQHLSGASLRSPSAVGPFDQTLWPSHRAILSRNVASKQGREDYIRVRLDQTCDAAPGSLAIPVTGPSGLLRTLIHSHGLLRIPANLEGLEAGTEVSVLLFPA